MVRLRKEKYSQQPILYINYERDSIIISMRSVELMGNLFRIYMKHSSRQIYLPVYL